MAEELVAELGGLVDDDFGGGPLRPARLEEVMRDNSIVVRRPPDTPSKKVEYQGYSGFSEVLGALAEPLKGLGTIRTHHKITDVKLTPSAAETTSLFEASGHSSDRTVQLTATWHCRWSWPKGFASLSSPEMRCTI